MSGIGIPKVPKRGDTGREFEKEMKVSLRRLKKDLWWIKMLDYKDFLAFGPQARRQTQAPADFVVMRGTEMHLLECKVFAALTSKNLSFAFSRLTTTQTRGLIKAACYPHIHSVVICKVLTDSGFRVWAMTIWDYVHLVLSKGAEGRLSARWMPDVMNVSRELFRQKNGWNLAPLWSLYCSPREMSDAQLRTMMWSLGKGRLVRAKKGKKRKLV